MTSVVNLRSYGNKAVIPTLVLLDLQQEYIAPPRLFAIPQANAALENCRAVLRHARQVGFPVAFLRMIDKSPFFNPALSYSKWISGFEPVSSDMVFERSKPSCYASREFANAMTECGGHFVLAGFSGEAACLATAMEAFHRDHRVTFLADASASHGLDTIAPQTVHETVVQLIGLFGEVTTAREWISGHSYGAARRVR
jgi:nicotinamidase-related amidase